MDYIVVNNNTLITQLPDILNANNQVTENYLNVFYDGTAGVIISPVTTPGKVKAAAGEFVNLVVDNLTVKSQYTNLYENITTANYDYWTAWTNSPYPLRAAINDGSTSWESTDSSYIDVNKPYYKIWPIAASASTGHRVALNSNNISQVVQLILDPDIVAVDGSIVMAGTYEILLDPRPTSAVRILNMNIDGSLLASQQTQWVTLFCKEYDASYGAIWEVYEYGNGTTGGGGSGGGGDITYAQTQAMIANAITPFTTNLITAATNASVNAAMFATISSVATDISPYATNASVNLSMLNTRATYIPDVSLSNDFIWNGNYLEASLNSIAGIQAFATNVSVNLAFTSNPSMGRLSSSSVVYNASIGVLTSRHNFTETSLYTLTGRHNVTETSLGTLTSRHNVTETSLGFTTSLVSALNTSMGSGLTTYATNSSVNLAFASNPSMGRLSSSSVVYNASIGVLTSRQNFTETSLYTLTGRHNVTEASLANLVLVTSLTALSDVSIVDASQNDYLKYNFSIGKWVNGRSDDASNYFYTKAQVDASFALIGTVGDVTKVYVDGSLATKASNASLYFETSNIRAVPILDACLGGGLSWSSGILYVDVSTIAGGVTFAYVDGSFSRRDASIVVVFNKTRITETSLGIVTGRQNVTETSLGILTGRQNVTETSLGSFATSTNASILVIKSTYISNASLSNDFVWNGTTLEVSLGSVYGLDLLASNVSVGLAFASNPSMGRLSSSSVVYNASIGVLTSRQNFTETSLYTLTTTAATNTSVGLAFYSNVSMGAMSQSIVSLTNVLDPIDLWWKPANTSIGLLTSRVSLLETSVGTLTTRVNNNDTSINWLTANKQGVGDYVKSASVGSTLWWHGGVFDISSNAAYATLQYVDGSFGNQQSQINSLSSRVTTLETSTGNVTYTYVNASLNARDASIVSLFNSRRFDEASMGTLTSRVNFTETSLYNITLASNTFATNTSVNLLIRPYATNSSVGSALTLYASKIYVDGSLSTRDGNISTLNSQVNTLTSRHNVTETSLYRLDASFNDTVPLISIVNTSSYYDASLNNIRATYVPSASLGTGLSFNGGTGKWDVSTSGAGVSQSYVDSSFATNASVNLGNAYYVKSASFNSTQFFWGKTSPGILDVSVAGGSGVSQSYVDSYNLIQDTSIYKINSSLNSVTPIGSYVNSSSYYDASINNIRANYIRSSSLNSTQFFWGKTSPGVLDVSVVGGSGVSQSYVDSYNLIQDTSIYKINSSLNSVTPIGSYVNSSSYYDGSLNNIRGYLPPSKTFQTLTISSSIATWSMATSYNATLRLTGNSSLNITNASNGDSGTLVVRQDSVGTRLLGLPIGSLKNSAWTLSTAANSVDIISFVYDGSWYYWNKGGPYA